MSREIIVAKNAGFCFGVQRAVDISVQQNSKGSKTYTLGPLIHNKDVINDLEDKGLYAIDEEDIGKLGSNDTTIIRAHGVTPQVMKDIDARGANIVDATCPYVSALQKKVKKYYNLGYQIIIVGDKDHPEVIGVNGYCDNSAIITKDGNDLPDLADNVCIVSQTTEKFDNYNKVVEIASKKSKDVLTFNTICKATSDRQSSADEVSKQVDLMVVIGGKNSSNSRKLYEICKNNCDNTIFIENKKELPEELVNDKSIKKVGITAGASTPDWIIEEVINELRG